MNTQTKTVKRLQLVNIIAFITVLTMNIVSNALPLNGRNAGEISDALPSYFTPAGYTFSIWSLIYLGLLGFTIYQALPSQRKKSWLPQIGWLFAASSIANIAWLFAWHYGYYPLSVAIMLTLLGTLIAIYSRLDIGRPNNRLPLVDRIFVYGSFSLYLGWISVATIANSASVLAYYGWNGFGIAGPVWSAIMMAVATLLAALMLRKRRNLTYAGVLIWALFGIRAAFLTIAVIANTALIAALIIAALAILGYVQTRESHPIKTAVPQAS